MQAVGKIMTTVFDVALSPFSNLPPIWGLLAVSILTGIVMVLIFKYTSNQSAIRSTKDRISAYFMEIRLFKDDLGLMLDAQKRILRTNLTYMKYSVVPMLVMIVPVVLILIQLGIRYAARPLKPGESALVELKLAEDVSAETESISVEPDNGLRLETPLLSMAGEVSFRIGAVKEGEHELSILVGDRRISTTIVVSHQVQHVYAAMAQPSFMGMLLYPGQETLPKGFEIEEIRIELPPQTVKILGWNMNWLVVFFLASILSGYSLKGVFKVEV